MQIADACLNHPWIVRFVAFGKRACPGRDCSEGWVRMRPGDEYARTMCCRDDEKLKERIEAMRV